jgi:hypothetical protein
MPILLKGQTVTIVRRTLLVDDSDNPIVDDYGNDQYVDITFEVPGCSISPAFSAEDFEGTESITDNVNVHMPNGTLVYALDAVIMPDGSQYEVVGQPHTWVSPFTGTLGPVEAKCKLVTSGGGVR